MNADINNNTGRSSFLDHRKNSLLHLRLYLLFTKSPGAVGDLPPPPRFHYQHHSHKAYYSWLPVKFLGRRELPCPLLIFPSLRLHSPQPHPAGSSLTLLSYMSRYISVQPGAHHHYSPNEHRALGGGSPHITRPSSYPFAASATG